MLVTNHLTTEITLATNGTITAAVTDPGSGGVVGGFIGWQTLPLILFRVAPGGSERVPLLIGTTSSTPRLGYAIPPGTWAAQATLTLGPDPRDGVRKRPRPLPLTITP